MPNKPILQGYKIYRIANYKYIFNWIWSLREKGLAKIVLLLKLTNCDGPTRYARIHFTRGRGLHLNSYNWAICEDLKLRREEGKGGEGELYTQ